MRYGILPCNTFSLGKRQRELHGILRTAIFPLTTSSHVSIINPTSGTTLTVIKVSLITMNTVTFIKRNENTSLLPPISLRTPSNKKGGITTMSGSSSINKRTVCSPQGKTNATMESLIWCSPRCITRIAEHPLFTLSVSTSIKCTTLVTLFLPPSANLIAMSILDMKIGSSTRINAIWSITTSWSKSLRGIVSSTTEPSISKIILRTGSDATQPFSPQRTEMRPFSPTLNATKTPRLLTQTSTNTFQFSRQISRAVTW